MERKTFISTPKSLMRGFTLLETLIAVGILVLVGGVAVGASSRAINTGTYSKNRTRAQDMARRQIEGLKVMRDNDYKAGREWNQSIDTCFAGAGRSSTGYVRAEEAIANITLSCGSGVDRKWSDSPIYHIVTRIEKVTDNFNGGDNGPGETDGNHYPSGLDESKNMRRITVTVTWSEPFLGGGNQKVELRSYLTNDKINN